LKKVKHSGTIVGNVKVGASFTHEDPNCIAQVENIIGGMRGLKSMLWEASVLDPIEVLVNRLLRRSVPIFMIIRVSAFMVSLSQIAKRFFRLLLAAKRSLQRVCSGSYSRVKYPLSNRLVNYQPSWQRRGSYPSLLKTLLMRPLSLLLSPLGLIDQCNFI